MNGFVAFFAGRHLLVNVLAIITIALGYLFISQVPREFIPSVASPTIYIRATLPGASAQDMETKITIPIEEAIESVDGIKKTYSTVSESASTTTVELYLDFTADQVRDIVQDLRDAVDGISDFPPEMEDKPTLTQFNPARRPVVEVALEGPTAAVIADAKRLELNLRRLNRVSSVALVGVQDPEVRVLLDPEAARTHGVTILDVVQAIGADNVSGTGDTLETASARLKVEVWNRYRQPEDVVNTVIKALPGGAVLRVGDVARIESGYEDTRLISHTDAKPGVSLVVRKRETADAIDAVDDVRRLVEATPLSPGVTYSIVKDGSFFISNRLQVMYSNGLMGAVLVAAVLFLFMGTQSSIWVLAGIPIVFMGALAVVGLSGLTLNIMVLNGLVIVLGMVVDDAVVVAENIVATMERGVRTAHAVVQGAVEMIGPVFAASLTTMIAFAPMLAIGGLPGKIVWQIPAVVVIVLLFSLLESFVVLPSHMTLLTRYANNSKRAFMTTLEVRYRTFLRFCLRHRWLVIAGCFSLLVFVFAVVRPLVPFVLFPQDDTRILFMQVTAPLGTPMEVTEGMARDVERQVLELGKPDIRTVTARIGHQDINGDDRERGEAEHQALVIAEFRELERAHTNQEWIEILREQLKVPPGVTVRFQSEYFGPPTDQPVTLHVLANDDTVRRSVAYEIANYLRATPGLTQVDIDEREGTPHLDLAIRHEQLARLGLTAATVTRTVQASFFGVKATEHRALDDTTEIRVQFDQGARHNVQSLLDTPIRAANGQLASLRDVVEPTQVHAMGRLYHRDGFRAATVRASFTPHSGHTALAFAGQVRRELLPRFDHLDGVEILVGGEAESTEETTGELGKVGIIVVFGIAMVIWILLGSLAEALLVMSVIPFAVAGVILAFFIHGLSLSMFAMIGAIGLAGVVVNSSIVMADAIHRLSRNASADVEAVDVMLDAVVSRLRPILITTLTTLGGVLPTAYGIGGYDTMVSPMSVAIGWGLFFATFITLILVPVLYSFPHQRRYGRKT
ncbi:MAG: efflux RND transporter permease subunit [Pseudomonadales bacterium]